MPTLTAPGHGSLTALTLTAMGPLLNAPSRDRQMPMPPPPRGSRRRGSRRYNREFSPAFCYPLAIPGSRSGTHPRFRLTQTPKGFELRSRIDLSLVLAGVDLRFFGANPIPA